MKINADKLRQAIAKVSPFVDTDEHDHYPKRAVLLRLEDGKVTLVATDGHRLAVVEFPDAIDLGPPQGFVEVEPIELVIPTSTLEDLTPLLTDGDVELDPDKRAFTVKGKRIVIGKVEGKFPPWQDVLPREEEYKRVAVVDRDYLKRVLKLALIVANSYSHAITFDFADSTLTVEANSSDAGEFEEPITLTRPVVGEPLRIGLNGRYLQEFLRVAAPGPIRAAFKSETNVIDFRALGEEDVSFRYLLLPMRV